MNQLGECDQINTLFTEEIPVWYGSDGKVSPKWLSACESERIQTSRLMERIVDPVNLSKACRQVIKNGGSGGVDGMNVQELRTWFQTNLASLQTELLMGSYHPEAVRGVQIPKPKGGYRQLGIPTVRDRLVQQAINRQLQLIYDKSFSAYSYGFRPGLSAHDGLKQAARYVGEGKRIVVNIDLEKFFDEVHHHRLLWLLGTRIGDQRVIQLINRFLQSGILSGGLISQRVKGTPQGSPLSPLLSNIVLDELDQELHRRGISFVRYADDMQIFTSSEQSTRRIQSSVTVFIRERMKLKVNENKSGIRQCYETNFLGHSLLPGGGLGLSKESEKRFRMKLKQITQRNRGDSLAVVLQQLSRMLRGCLQYFRYASMKKKLLKIEGWLRRRLKCFRIKQCKRKISTVRFLIKLGVEKQLSWRTALSGKGWWRLSNSPAISIGMNNRWFAEQGFFSLSLEYEKLRGKSI